MSPPIGVIADDFTGACDVGVQFKKRGLETAILTDVKNLRRLEASVDVVVVDTETRNLIPKAAYDKIQQTLKAFRKFDIKLFYKKIDSTLRGNIGAEFDAVLDELKLNGILLAPSYPQQGRTIVNGQAFVKGVLLEETEFAHDLISPVKESRLLRLIRQQSNYKIGYINLSVVRAEINELKVSLKRLLEEGNKIIVADAETQEDLANIAEALVNLYLLPCGSAGLAQNIVLPLARKRGLVVVSGSVNNVTTNQIKVAGEKLGIPILEPILTDILVDDEKLQAAAVDLAEKSVTILQETGDIILRLASSKNVVQKTMETGESHGISRVQILARLLSILSKTVKEITNQYRLADFVFIGGDTSASMMDAIEAEGIRIEAEILAGVPVGKILGGEHEGALVATKAGGFGDNQTLIKIIEYMKNKPKFI
jgi:uncharacterized protein YgbK (DUF1537 family)